MPMCWPWTHRPPLQRRGYMRPSPRSTRPRGHIAADLPVLDTRVRFVGDEVAAVAAEDADTAAAALDLILVEYRTLPFVVDPEEALQSGAPQLYPDGNLATGRPLVLERGDVARGFAEADLILEDVFRTPGHSPSPLEPRAALASWEGGQLTVWKCTRGVHQDRAALASALEIDPENIRVVGPPLGAGYGAKDETRLAALAAVLAQRSGRPVRIELSRDEEFVAGRVRHARRPANEGWAQKRRHSDGSGLQRCAGYRSVPSLRAGRTASHRTSWALPLYLHQRTL